MGHPVLSVAWAWVRLIWVAILALGVPAVHPREWRVVRTEQPEQSSVLCRLSPPVLPAALLTTGPHASTQPALLRAHIREN